MSALRKQMLAVAGLVLTFLVPAVQSRAGEEELPPYTMLRSMQFVQDSVILGDHSAGEMQRYIMGTIDKRLRAVDSSVFEDPRNVDAALIYAMSGGNPATLDYLVARDVQGYFDNRVTDVLRKYLAGKGPLASKALIDMRKEYADTEVGPYLALIAGNTLMASKPEEALKMYDWARLTAPGTIIEESALRRSITVALNAGLTKQGLDYSNQYARRFLHSPYASEFADLFVALAVNNIRLIGLDKIRDTVDIMEPDRRQAIYLRMSRQATIAGQLELARLAAREAAKIKSPSVSKSILASFYGGLADIPSDNIDKAAQGLELVPEALLSPKDRVLKAAAQVISEEVLKQPNPESLAQDIPSIEDEGTLGIDADAAGHELPAPGQDQQGAPSQDVAAAGVPKADPKAPVPADPAIDPIVTSARSKLGEIDKLLEKDSSPP